MGSLGLCASRGGGWGYVDSIIGAVVMIESKLLEHPPSPGQQFNHMRVICAMVPTTHISHGD